MPDSTSPFGFLPSQTVARRKNTQTHKSLRQQAQRVMRESFGGDTDAMALELARTLGNQDQERSRQSSAAVAPTVIERELSTNTAVNHVGTTTLIPQIDLNIPCNGIIKADWTIYFSTDDAAVCTAYLVMDGTSLTTYPAKLSVTAAAFACASMSLCLPVRGGKHKLSMLCSQASGAGTVTVQASVSRLILTVFRSDNADVVRKNDFARIGPALPAPIK